MRKRVGIIKRNIAIFLIIAMSINSFGAVISDNDGSAFITKSEFDALKSSFQSQIDTYNNSIDSKIDGAIASYLAGISMAKEMDVTMPTSQRLFKTLDASNFPVSFDNVRLQFILASLHYYSTSNSHPAWSWYVNYSQNNKTKESKSFVVTRIQASPAVELVRGYTHHFYRDLKLTAIQQSASGNTDSVYQRFANMVIYDGNDGSGTYKSLSTYVGKQKQSVPAYPKIFGVENAGNLNISDKVSEADPDSDSKIVASSCNYEIASDQLIMPCTGVNFPVQFDNVRGQNFTGGKYFDMEYVKWGATGQTVSGWGVMAKLLRDVTQIKGDAGWQFADDAEMVAKFPGAHAITNVVASRSITYTSSGTVQAFIDDAHAYYTSASQYYFDETKAVTDAYQASGLTSKIKTVSPTFIKTISGADYYLLSGGLVLCDIEKTGTLTFGVTAKTDNVYLYLYNQPSTRTTAGLNVNGFSDTARGNGIALTKNIKKTISVDVDKGIYFFRFGTYGGNWKNLGGGAKIEFDDTFTLNIEN